MSIMKNTEALIDASKEAGVEVNTEKNQPHVSSLEYRIES
jgi:hypothetical protein